MFAVVLSYNHPQITQRCLDSVLLHFPPQRILLVHNGSLIQHQEQLKRDNTQIHHLCLANNLGFSGGANAGLRWAFAHSDWVLFVTNDTQLLKLSIPQIKGFIAPMIFARKVGKVDSLGGQLDFRSASLSHLKEFNLGETQHPFLNSSSQQKFYVPGTAFWLDRDSYQLGGGFNESLHTYWEDVELSLRYQQLGIHLGVDTQTEFLHAIGKTCHKDSHYTTYLFQRNRISVSGAYSPHKWRTLSYLATEAIQKLFKLYLQKEFAKGHLLWRAVREGFRTTLQNSFSTKPPKDHASY